MFSLSYQEIISKIKEEKNLSDDEIEQRIKDKLRQLSDLISKEGAAHIVANELGVQVANISREVKINQLMNGMNNVTIIGKVVKVNDIVQYNKNLRQGRVVSFLVADDSGIVRVVFWDSNHIREIEDGNIKGDVVIKIKNGYVRANNGYKELHLGNRGQLEIDPPGVKIDVVNNVPILDYIRKKIIDLNEGDTNVGVFGTVVQVFELRFYEACRVCGKKVDILEDKRQCKEHGIVDVEFVPILNISFDDGTDNLRAVAFRNQVEAFLGLNKEQVLEIMDDPAKFGSIKNELLGKQLILVGRIVKNGIFNRKEMSIQRILEVKPEEILKELENEV